MSNNLGSHHFGSNFFYSQILIFALLKIDRLGTATTGEIHQSR